MSNNIKVDVLQTNVVPVDKLRDIQINTLRMLQEYLSMTFGPMGSNTKIITGNTNKNIASSYSKDGLKVLKNISCSGPIEMSIIEELIDVTRHVEGEVGDGTTSTVILSSLIFEQLVEIQNRFNIPPFQLIQRFKNIVNTVKEIILENKKDCTLDHIYDISMISTNGNKAVSRNIYDIYEKYGMDVDLSVGVSTNTESYIREYDGLTITEGMDDPAYINNKAKGTAEIRNARIYHFADPIDDYEMVRFFEIIMMNNIYKPISEDEQCIPTVVVCPRISRDMTASLKQLVQTLYQYDTIGSEVTKPPILIVTNVVASDEVIMDDIANLCGCKSIRKYIDPKMKEIDQSKGLAPTEENVINFYGTAELVVSDAKKTKFINPAHMKHTDEEGNVVEDPIYQTMINFLETEIATCIENGGTSNDLGLLKKRLAALKANMVEYLIGGVTVTERDSVKDLVEDAIKNCKSSTKYGVGYAANYEGLKAATKLMRMPNKDEIDAAICTAIINSYKGISKILYSTVCTDEALVDKYVEQSINNGLPYDISKGYLPDINDMQSGKTVTCSIMLDINILDTISKIITIMVTSNQCLLQAPNLNTY